jgi:hypothetical protein
MAPSMPNRGFRNEAAGLFATKTPAFTTQEANPRKLRDIRLSHIAHPRSKLDRAKPAYLLGLAMHKKRKLATMDKGVSDLLVERRLEREFVVMI